MTRRPALVLALVLASAVMSSGLSSVGEPPPQWMCAAV